VPAGVDEASVAPLTPERWKGLGVLAGQLLVQVSTLSNRLRAIVSVVRAWTARQPGAYRRSWERGGRRGVIGRARRTTRFLTRPTICQHNGEGESPGAYRCH
jgi:hypothetical protein